MAYKSAFSLRRLLFVMLAIVLICSVATGIWLAVHPIPSERCGTAYIDGLCLTNSTRSGSFWWGFMVAPVMFIVEWRSIPILLAISLVITMAIPRLRAKLSSLQPSSTGHSSVL